MLAIVEGTHELWDRRGGSISEPYKQTVRSFLVHFFHQTLQRASA